MTQEEFFKPGKKIRLNPKRVFEGYAFFGIKVGAVVTIHGYSNATGGIVIRADGMPVQGCHMDYWEPVAVITREPSRVSLP